MTDKQSIEGGCYCGKVRYQISKDPLAVGICHCRSCQRTAGADSVAWAVNNADAFEFSEGEPTVFASSEGVERTFCSACGSTLTYRQTGSASIDVTLATLDDPEALPPTKEIWCEDRLSWNALNDRLSHFDRESR